MGIGSVSAYFTAPAKITKPAVMSSAGIKSDDRVTCILHLRASKTLILTAPDMNYVGCEIEIVLADGRRAADWDITVFWAAHGQATACLFIHGVSDAKRHRGREISVRTWAEGWRRQRFGKFLLQRERIKHHTITLRRLTRVERAGSVVAVARPPY